MNRNRILWANIGIVVFAAAISGFMQKQPSPEDILTQSIEASQTVIFGAKRKKLM